MNQSVRSKLISYANYLVAAVLVLVPFHAFLSVWAGTGLGAYDVSRLWKEGLLVLLAALAGWFLWRSRRVAAFWSQPLVWVAAAYVGLTVGAALLALAGDGVTTTAALYGVTINARFVVFFLAVGIIAAQSAWLKAHWQQIVFIPAGLVVGFGLLQAFVLPNDFLSSFGYGPDTIPVQQTVDQKDDYARVQSTLRGANPLGAYLVVIIGCALSVLLAEKPAGRKRWLLGGLLLGAVIVLFYSYSRSAYIGAVVAAGVACWLLMGGWRWRRSLLVAAAALVLVFGGLTLLLRNNDTVQNVLFHTNEHSASANSSNHERTQALTNGIEDVVHEPLGRGPGTAGPASVHNDGQVRIAENYYLQIGQEIGWLGVGLFVALLIVVGVRLFGLAPDPLAAGLLASLIGLGVVNLFVHAWADDTLSYLWWGLAGIAILTFRK